VTDKPTRLTGDQLDRLIVLQRRQIQLAEQRLRRLGVSQADIDAATAQADLDTIPLADGGTIALEGDDYRLVDHDETSVTLRRG
jgi:hypothetical protein